jgi:hypothetical protein
LRRRRWNGLKKLGLLSLAIVLALGTLGVAYSAWTSSIYVQGTVNTGTLDIDPMASSSTFVYKVPNAGGGYDIVVHYCPGDEDQDPPKDGDGVPYTAIAWAITDFSNHGGDQDLATMDFYQLFPNVDFRADLTLQYFGSIPAKVLVATINDPDYPAPLDLGKLLDLWQNGDSTYLKHTYGIWIDARLSTDDGENWSENPIDPLGVQLHDGDLLEITLHALLPPDSTYADLDLDFTGIVTVIQWNEYGS